LQAGLWVAGAVDFSINGVNGCKAENKL